MNWEAIGAIGEILGALAVFVTLIYLAVQIKQNTRSIDTGHRLAQTQAQQQWTSMFNDSILTMAESEYYPQIMSAVNEQGIDSLNNEDRDRLSLYMTAMAARLDMMHLQYEQGFLAQETYDATFVGAIRHFGPIWMEVGAFLDLRRPGFQREVRQLLEEESTSP